MKKVSPFIKWVGGKSKLISEIDRNLPDIIKDDFTYVEPFLGGGAVFFHLISNYKIKNAYLNDLNIHLINTYIDLRDNYRLLCKFLKDIQLEYENSEDKKNYYLNKRKEFNSIKKSIEKSSLFIFLNKTGFNGMYRENSKGEFNIPFGDMKNPKIFNK
jgi:DNA adenine methylase